MARSSERLFNPESVEFLGFRVDQFKVEAEEGFDPQKIKGFTTNSVLEIGLNPAQRRLQSILRSEVNSVGDSDKTKSASGSFVVVFTFDVSNFEELVRSDKKGELTTDYDLALSIASITYSTARGILLVKCQGTPLFGAVLPVINPADLLQK